MLFRHKLLMFFADGQPHELRELFSMLGRQIRPEQAARKYRENSKYAPEERLQKGRMRIIVEELSSLKRNGWIKAIAGTDLYRTYIITETGIAKAELVKEQTETDGVIRPKPPGSKFRRSADPVVADAANDVIENLKILITDQWTDEDTLFQVSTENVSQETAVRAHLYYSRAKAGKQTPDQVAYYGKRLLFTRCTGYLGKFTEAKMEKGKRWIRLKPPTEDVFPKLAKIG